MSNILQSIFKKRPRVPSSPDVPLSYKRYKSHDDLSASTDQSVHQPLDEELNIDDTFSLPEIGNTTLNLQESLTHTASDNI